MGLAICDLVGMFQFGEVDFTKLFEDAPIGMAVIGLDCRLLRANKFLCRMLGYGEPELVRMALADLTHPDDRAADALLLEGAKDHRSEKRYIGKDGRILWIRQTVSLMRDEGGRPICGLAIMEDITDHKGMAESLRRSEESYRQLIESASDIIYRTDYKGNFTYVNPVATRITEYQAEELLSKNYLELVRPDWRNQIQDFYSKQFRDRIPLTYCELPIVTKSGKEVWIGQNIRLIAEGDRVVEFQGVARNITERKRAELELWREKEFSENLINSSLDGILAFDRECRYTVWNPGMERISGVSKEACLGRCAFEVFPFLKEIGEDSYFYEALAGNTVIARDRPYTVPETGRRGFFEGHYSPLRNQAGEIVGGLAIIRDITGQKLAEEALKKSEARYRALFESNPQPMWIYDLETLRFLVVNDAAIEHYGYSREEFLAMTLRDIRPPEDVPLLLEHLKSLAESSQKFYAARNIRHRKKDGTIIDVEVISHEVEWNGRKARLVSINDVTERKRAEEAVRESEEWFKEVFEGSRDAIFLVDSNARFIGVNEAACKLTGYSREELLNMSIPDLHEEGDLKAFRKYFDRILSGMEVTSEAPLLRKDGKKVQVEFSNKMINIRGRRLMHTIARDITERKRAEEALIESERKYRTLFDQIADPVFIIDKVTHRFIDCNRTALSVYGYSRDELLRLTPFDLHPPEERRLVEGAIDLKSDGRQTWTHLSRDGRRMSVWVRSEEIEYQGRPAWLAIVRDVTDQKQIEAELERAREAAEAASRAKSEFLAMISHEIRTPMNGVIGMIGLLLDTELNSEQREYAEAARNSAESLLAILNEILDLSKVESGKLSLEPAPFNLSEVVSEVADLFSGWARQKGLDLLVRRAPGSPSWVVGDAERIRQILNNLVANSIKFTSRGYVLINVEGIKEGDAARLKISVEDSGIGIPEDKLEHVFEEFVQADSYTTRQYGGTGLGLAICKRLVELMGGKIGVESRVGEGSKFWFELRLPLSANQIEGQQERQKTIPRRFENRRILVVEDNAVNQKIAVKLLEKMGCRVDVAGNGREAVEMVRSFPYDLVFMDCQMPEMDGFEATRLIRNWEANNGKRIRIVAMTAHAMNGDRERCMAAGMDGYIAKPIRAEDLIEVLEEFNF
jgi:PAS domain S-box-containing protein